MKKLQISMRKLKQLKKMVNCEFIKMVHDEFTFTNSVYGRVSIFIPNKILNINNQLEELEFYGAKEDIALLSLTEANISEVGSLLDNKKQIEMPAKNIITSIDILNYQIYIKIDGKEYDNSWTEGIIFNFKNSQIAFCRSDRFTELIEIYKGYDLISKITPLEEYGKSFINPQMVKTKKNIISIKQQKFTEFVK